MKNKKPFYIGLILGIFLNSINVDISKPFRFNNPIPYAKEISYAKLNKKGDLQFITETVPLSKRDINKIIESRPLMKDYKTSLDILGIKIPLFTVRKIKGSMHSSIKGFLMSNGDIFNPFVRSYELKGAHDSNWYEIK